MKESAKTTGAAATAQKQAESLYQRTLYTLETEINAVHESFLEFAAATFGEWN